MAVFEQLCQIGPVSRLKNKLLIVAGVVAGLATTAPLRGQNSTVVVVTDAIVCKTLMSAKIMHSKADVFETFRPQKSDCVVAKPGTVLLQVDADGTGFVGVRANADGSPVVAWTYKGWLKDGPPAQLKPETVPFNPAAAAPLPAVAPSAPATLTAPSARGGICDLARLSISAQIQHVDPENFIAEITTKCKGGDLISFPSGYTYVMKKACDFRQQIVTTPREIQCVYSGALRPG